MILGRLREHRDKSSLVGAFIKGGFVVVKAGKLLLALASFAAYAFLFTWQFAVIIVGMLVIHECGHLRCMKHYGMKTWGIYLIPLLGAAAVAEDNFPSRRAEATVALAGPLTGAVLAGGTGLVYFATGNGAFAAAAAWMALINLFNLLPVVPLDGGRVLKSITCSIGSRIGLVAVIAGMLLATAARRTQAANLTSSPQRSEGSSRKPDLACYVKAPRSQPSARCGKSTFSPRSRAPDSPRRDTDLGESGVRAPRQAIC